MLNFQPRTRARWRAAKALAAGVPPRPAEEGPAVARPMSPGRRVDVYLAQNGGGDIADSGGRVTARQRRRAAKKAYRWDRTMAGSNSAREEYMR